MLPSLEAVLSMSTGEHNISLRTFQKSKRKLTRVMRVPCQLLDGASMTRQGDDVLLGGDIENACRLVTRAGSL
jgi:hypothetical protein